MKLFLISQNINNGYDTYDSAVVCAENEDEAKKINPDGYGKEVTTEEERYSSWTTIDNVDVEYLGEAKEELEAGVVCASFNAG